MIKRTVFVTLIVLILGNSWALAGDLEGFQAKLSCLPSNLISHMSPSVAVTDNALSSVLNPAGLAVREGADFMFLLPYDRHNLTDDVGMYLRAGAMGFDIEWVRRGFLDYERYTLSHGMKFAPGVYFGFGYSWYEGVDHGGSWTLGLRGHPCKHVSLAAVADGINEPKVFDIRQKTRYTFGMAARPLNDRLTVSVDAGLFETGTYSYGDAIDWDFRVEAEPIDGIHLIGSYKPENDFRDESFGIGLEFATGYSRLGEVMSIGSDGKIAEGTGIVQFSTGYQRTIAEPKHRYVSLTIQGNYPEEKPPFRLFAPRKTTFAELLERIQRLEEDPAVEGMTLKLKGPKMSPAKYQEIRDALVSFKEAGKKIVCYMESCGNYGYYLASVADKIAMIPTGDAAVVGMRGRAMFLKNTLEKLGITAELYQIAEYKTAADLLTRESMSEAHREMINSLLDDLYDQYTETIAQSRGWTQSEFKSIIDQGPYTGAGAYEAGLVDTLIFQDELQDLVKQVGGEKINMVSGCNYWCQEDYETEWETPFVNKIAIVYATGAIESGKSGSDMLFGKTMGSETVADAIRVARNDPQVKAIILRIDSGGGSALASDVILREAKLCTEGDDAKPFIVSMSGVAGSGGYYIACLADTIVADAGTITGSIGVITGKLSFSGLYEKIGVNFETLNRGDHASIYDTDRGFTDDEWKLVKAQCHEIYDTFVENVAEGRDMTPEEVDEIGKGRVWTGNQAKKIGLVDEIGGLRLAIEIAKEVAEIPETRDVEYTILPKPKGFGFGHEINGIISDYLSPEIKAMASQWKRASNYRDGEPLLLMPFELEIQ